MLEMWFDGAVEPVNPGGWGGYGVVIKRGAEVLREISGLIQKSPHTSNNVAEYRALMEGLAWLAAQGLKTEPLLVRGDSKLVIEQMFGRWKIKGGMYAPLARQVKGVLLLFSQVQGQWIPREQNGAADELSKRELLRVLGRLRLQPEESPRSPGAPQARHSWEKTSVEVPWTVSGGNLYTCRKCKMQRQSVPFGAHYVHEFTSVAGRTTKGKTPPCQAEE